jgi:50S ribosomal protein L16 3-hydroxylase
MTSPLTHLGKISVGRFMREYWQRKPLLARAVFKDWAVVAPPVGRARLFDLAGREDVESRLIVHRGRNWSLRDGPFARRALPRFSQKRWTLLVQGLDLVDAGARRLLSRFRFVPDARLDDLMASYATDGGGVGPHVDNYDVFLLQAQGRRRWQISRQRALRLQPDQPLKLLAGFHATQEWLLEPGDLLYLPPGVAHYGVAEGECITYSIGFRAPAYQELHDPWLASFAEREHVAGRYADPDQRATLHPAVLPPAMVTRVHAALSRSRPTRGDTERFLLGHLSEPKSQVVFDRPQRLPSLPAFERAARRRGVVLDIRSRMLSGRAAIALNGEIFEVDRRLLPALRKLADRRALGAGALVRAPRQLLVLLHEWCVAGWLHVGPTRLYRRSPDLP